MKIFLDACAIIYWVEMAEPQYGKFVETLQNIRKEYKKSSFAASHLSLLECRVKPLRDHNGDLLERYRQFFCGDDLTLISISPEIIEKATELRAFYHLRTPDAFQAATALSISEKTVFVTGDITFQKIPTLSILLMDFFPNPGSVFS